MRPYEVLEISPNATGEEVRAAYRTMAKKWHPDRKLDDQEGATKKFMEIDSAYRAILRERRRQEAKKQPPPTSSEPSSSSSSPSSRQENIDPVPSCVVQPNKGDCHPSHSKTKNAARESNAETSFSDSGRVANVDLLCDENNGTLRQEKESSCMDRTKLKFNSRPLTTDSRTSSSASVSSGSSASSALCSPSVTSMSPARSELSPEKQSSSDVPLSTTSPQRSTASLDVSSLHEQKQDLGNLPPRTLPSFTSYTSSEASTYDNPGVPLPHASVVHNENTEMNEAEPEPIFATPDDSTTFTTPSTSSSQPSDASELPEENISKRMRPPKKKRDSDSKKRDCDEEARTLIPEFDCPLARSFGVFQQWTYTIRLNLKDLFNGKKLRFRVVRCKLNGKRKTIILNVDIPPGSAHGTQIIFKSTGHERKDGSRQDIHFILEEEKHEKFVRVKDDLVLDVRLPWVESLKKEKGVVHVKGLDGMEERFEVDFMKEGNVTGSESIEGAGMPVLGTKQRGNLIVRWEIFMPSAPTRWEVFKQALHL